MANTLLLPKPLAALVGPGGLISREWYDYLVQLELRSTGDNESTAELAAAVRAIATALGSPDGTVAGIPPLAFLPGDTTISGPASVQVFGTLAGGAVTVQLVADTSVPGPWRLYATSATGARGWQPLEDGLLAGTGLAVSADPLTGEVTYALADLADSGVGDLLAITRDAQGRVSGTRAADVSDLEALELNLLPNAVDDAAAAGLGVAVGGLYRNGSVLMVRVA